MLKKEKIEKVEDLKKIFEEADSIIFTDHSGLKAENSYFIRSKLTEVEATFKIIKNTLAIRAVDQVFKDVDFSSLFKGPTSMVVCGKDAAIVSKILKGLSKDFETFKIKGGFFEGKIYDSESIERLSSLPSKEIIISQLLGLLNNPMVGLVTTLSALPRNLAAVLDAVRQQKENQQEAA